MEDFLRKQIYDNLNLRETEDLLEIWQAANTDEWAEGTFEIIREILLERLGSVPPQSMQFQAGQILSKIDGYLDAGELEKALSECERAIQMAPSLASAYNYRGLVYDEMGELEKARSDYQAALRLDPRLQDARKNLLSLEQDLEEELHQSKQAQANRLMDKVNGYLEADKLEKAMSNYQAAVRLDPGLEPAWDNLLGLEKELEKKFQGSPAKAHLDRALEYAYDEEPGLAMEECALARPDLPDIAIAYNYLGMILEELEQTGPAIQAYLEAIQRNPHFYAARENLANARVKWEQEQYRQIAISMEAGDQAQEEQAGLPEAVDWQKAISAEDDLPVPGWVYTDENAYWLWGWPGHRTRPGRTGYDPLDSDFESAHIEGVIIRQLLRVCPKIT